MVLKHHTIGNESFVQVVVDICASISSILGFWVGIYKPRSNTHSATFTKDREVH